VPHRANLRRCVIPDKFSRHADPMDTLLISSPVRADRQHLQQAFAVFNQASEQLTGAYLGLQDQVGRLTGSSPLPTVICCACRTSFVAINVFRRWAKWRRVSRTSCARRLPRVAVHREPDPCRPRQRAARAVRRESVVAPAPSGMLIADMLLFVKGEASVVETLAVCDLLSELRQVVEPQMARDGLRFRMVDNSAAASATADRKALSSALLSLLENAMQASPRAGQ